MGDTVFDTTVRAMTRADIESVRRVELNAGTRFRSIDEPRIARCADAEPFTAAELVYYIDAGRAWVTEEQGAVAGFVVVDIVDGCAHVEEIAVAPEFGRRGYGTAMLDAVERWAAANGHSAVTLTTFRDVPFNGPWYEGLGFRVIAGDELTPGLRDAAPRRGRARFARGAARRDAPRRQSGG